MPLRYRPPQALWGYSPEELQAVLDRYLPAPMQQPGQPPSLAAPLREGVRGLAQQFITPPPPPAPPAPPVPYLPAPRQQPGRPPPPQADTLLKSALQRPVQATRQLIQDYQESPIDPAAFAMPFMPLRGVKSSQLAARRALNALKGKKDKGVELLVDVNQQLNAFSQKPGVRLPPRQDPALQARLYQGRYGDIDAATREFDDIILRSAANKIWGATKKEKAALQTLEKLERHVEKAGQGITRFPPDEIPPGVHPAEVLREFRTGLLEQVGPKQFARIEQASREATAWRQEGFKEYWKAGFVRDDAAGDILKSNQKFVSFRRVLDKTDPLEGAPVKVMGRRSMQVSKEEVIRQMQGSELPIKDTFETSIDDMMRMKENVHRNKVMDTIADLATHPAWEGEVVALETSADVFAREAALTALKSAHQEVRVLTKAGKRLKRPLGVLEARYTAANEKFQNQLLESIEAEMGGAAPSELNRFQDSLTSKDRRIQVMFRKLARGKGESREIQAAIADYRVDVDKHRRLLKSHIAAPLPEDMDKVYRWHKGVRESYAIPKEVAGNLKGMNKFEADILTQYAGKFGQVFRAGVTTFSVPFHMRNIGRDVLSAMYRAPYEITGPDIANAFMGVLFDTKTHRQFLKSRGAMGGIISQVDRTAFELRKSKMGQAKAFLKGKAPLGQGRPVRVVKTIINPAALLKTMGSAIENATRQAVWARQLKGPAKRKISPDIWIQAFRQHSYPKGLDPDLSAFWARDATVDFPRMGSLMKLFNQWAPLTAARFQGTNNILASMRDHPIRSAWRTGKFVAMPTALAYFWNTTYFPKIYDQITDEQDESDLTVIYGPTVDKQGRATDAFRIPKDAVLRQGNFLLQQLKNMRREDPVSFRETAINFLGDMSPFPIIREGKFSGERTIGGLLPPLARGAVEVGTNRKMWEGRYINPPHLVGAEPPQNLRTGEPQWMVDTSKMLYEKTGLKLHPAEIARIIESQLGTAGRQIANPSKAFEVITRSLFGARGGRSEKRRLDLLYAADKQRRGELATRRRLKYEFKQDPRGSTLKDWMGTYSGAGFLNPLTKMAMAPSDQVLSGLGARAKDIYLTRHLAPGLVVESKKVTDGKGRQIDWSMDFHFPSGTAKWRKEEVERLKKAGLLDGLASYYFAKPKPTGPARAALGL